MGRWIFHGSLQAMGLIEQSRKSRFNFAKCRDGIVSLPDGAKHGDAVKTKGANLRETLGSDTAEREHGSTAFIRCAKI